MKNDTHYNIRDYAIDNPQVLNLPKMDAYKHIAEGLDVSVSTVRRYFNDCHGSIRSYLGLDDVKNDVEGNTLRGKIALIIEKEPMTLKEICRATGVNTRTVRAAILFGTAEGAIKFHSIGKKGRAKIWTAVR